MSSRLILVLTVLFSNTLASERFSSVQLDEVSGMDALELLEARPAAQLLDALGRWSNAEAVIPPQCYTRIEARYNPCYVCHQSYSDFDRPNAMRDGLLQSAYNFSSAAMRNHWSNLFVDRSLDVAAISDAYIRSWIAEDNYASLRTRLSKATGWSGFQPDIRDYGRGSIAFGPDGLARDGSGWVAFNYKPLPSTFWPVNGSTDDVLIRLPAPFRRTEDGKPDRAVYFRNLAQLEMAFQELEHIDAPDGRGGVQTVKRSTHYHGAAQEQTVHRMLYPYGTEFLHSVRYVAFDANGLVVPSTRMKELRYMRKIRFYNPAQLRTRYSNELQDKIDENLPRFVSAEAQGLDNGMGWQIAGFIEDHEGQLRAQTDEETFFCKGCHTTVGSTLDQTFAFPRKLKGASGWGYINYAELSDAPNRGEQDGEILTYFVRAGGVNEFREIPDSHQRYFRGDGQVDAEAVRAASLSQLIAPSPERALALNKAWHVIAREQSFLFGRDATITPPRHVHRHIKDPTATALPPQYRYTWDIRLDW